MNGFEPCQWVFGWPFPSHEKAHRVIPRFSDDAKIKALEMLDASGTIAEFQELLQITGECGSGRFSAFFSILPAQDTFLFKADSVLSSKSWKDFEKFYLNFEFDKRDKAQQAFEGLKCWYEQNSVSFPYENSTHLISNQVQKPIHVSNEPEKRKPDIHQLSASLIKRKKS